MSKEKYIGEAALKDKPGKKLTFIIKDGSVTTHKIADENVTTEKVANEAVTTPKIAEQAITDSKLGDSSVIERTINEGAVTTPKIASGAVETDKIANENVTNEKLAGDSVTTSKIKDESVTTEKLAKSSVETSKIKNEAITNEKIANDSLTKDKLDPELRKALDAAVGLPDDLVTMIQDVDQSVKQLHEKDTDLQSQIDDKQQQITANDEDISLLQTRSTQMEETIKGIATTGGASQATAVTYDNANSQLSSINIQSAVDELQGSKIDKTSILQESGDAEDKVMSQKAVSDKFSDLNRIVNNVTSYDSSVLTEEGLMNNQGIVGDKAFMRTKPISLKEIDSIVLKTTIGIVADTYPSIVFFKDNKVSFYLKPSSSGLETINISDFKDADYAIINCIKTKISTFTYTTTSRYTTKKITDLKKEIDVNKTNLEELTINADNEKKKAKIQYKGMFLNKLDYAEKLEQVIYIKVFSDGKYDSLTLSVINRIDDRTFGFQFFKNKEIIDSFTLPISIKGDIIYASGWGNSGILYLDIALIKSKYEKIQSTDSGIEIVCQNLQSIDRFATTYDSSVLTEEGLMNNQGIVGDKAFMRTKPISLAGIDEVILETTIGTTDTRYPYIIFFKDNKLIRAEVGNTTQLSKYIFKNLYNADYFITNCIASSKDSFKLTLLGNNINRNTKNIDNIIKSSSPILVSQNGDGDYTSLSEAIIFSNYVKNCVIYIEEGTYNLIDELKNVYGETFFDTFNENSNIKGLYLCNNTKLLFSTKSKVVCNYNGDNKYIHKLFSPFNSKEHGFEILGLNLVCSNVRYGIHDERFGSEEPYFNIYKGCNIKIDNTNNLDWGARQCIGGGLGKNGYISITDCIFDSTIKNGNEGVLTYHNNAFEGSKSKIIIHGNVVKNGDYIRMGYHGKSSDISEVYISNNIVGKDTELNKEEETDSIENIRILEWNNILKRV